MDLKTRINSLRTHVQTTANSVNLIKKQLVNKGQAESPDEESRIFLKPVSDASEMVANLMLAYRHLEDARMRLGKVIQAWDGGESCYDKEPTALELGAAVRKLGLT